MHSPQSPTFRHEYKHEINYADLLAIRRRLRAIAQPDAHAIDGQYLIRSLYFDTPGDRALREKLYGIDRREKFRIRYYNGDTTLIHLEKKCKQNGLGHKAKAPLTAAQVQSVLQGDTGWMPASPHPLIQELYSKMTCQGLRPRTIVQYIREPFVYPPGNTRVTLDHSIRTGLSCRDFLRPDCPTIPAGSAPIILEVKWDAFLPAVIRDAVQVPGRRTAPFSKYAACRIYG